uniref:Uncharacterized protein n=1 Tax=Nymphaea colorata TaxID=210225 RepID=A0A5K0XJB3_9MAGN
MQFDLRSNIYKS